MVANVLGEYVTISSQISSRMPGVGNVFEQILGVPGEGTQVPGGVWGN